eukprot:3555397-Pyramimonas_sp.AAC.2
MLCSYCRKFIDKFAHIAAPLRDLTEGHKKRQNLKFNITDANTSYGLNNKTAPEKLTTHPVLLLPDFGKPFTVVPDASRYAIGGVLCQDHGAY